MIFKDKSIYCQRVFLIILLFVMIIADTLQANTIRWTGMGSEASALGGMQSSIPSSTGSLLGNPALLTEVESGVWGGIILIQNRLKIKLKERDKETYDVPPSIYQSSVAITSGDHPLDRPLATRDLINPRSDTLNDSTMAALNLSMAFSPLSPNFKIAAAIVSALEPIQSFSTWYNDEREQFFSNRLHFERFGENDGVQLIMIGLAQKINIISAGLTILIDMTSITKSQLFIPEGSVQTYSYLDAETKTSGRLRFIGGISLQPATGMLMTAVFRQPTYLEVKGEGRLQLWNFDRYPEGMKEIVQPYHFIIGYKPMELSGGISYTRGRWSGGICLTWQRWSDFRDRHAQKPEQSFKDVAAFIASLKFNYRRKNMLLGGVGFYPSPVANQNKKSNYVDGNILLFSAGHLLKLNIANATVEVALSLQIWNMMKRETTKNEGYIRDEYPDGSTDLRTGKILPDSQGLQTNNPGFPGFTSSGWAFSETITIGILI